MTAVGPGPKISLSLFTPKTLAAALWKFVHPRPPRFASDTARKSVETLDPSAAVEELATSIRERKMLELGALKSWISLIASMSAAAPKGIFLYAVGASRFLDINPPGVEQ